MSYASLFVFLSACSGQDLFLGKSPLAGNRNVTNFSDPRFVWWNEPANWSICADGSLEVMPDLGTDLWSKTYYPPPLPPSGVVFNANALLAEIAPETDSATLTLEMTYWPEALYDQTGVLVKVDNTTWMKAGLEYFSETPHVSCVVTNNGFSDWSTHRYHFDAVNTSSTQVSLKLRVTKTVPSPEQGPAIFVEMGVDKGSEVQWDLLRLLPLRSLDKPWYVGPFAAAPTTDAHTNRVKFTSVSLSNRSVPCLQC